MKLLVKETGEIINAIFEGCEGNVKVINKDNPELFGEYSTLSGIMRDFSDVTENLKEN